MRPARSPRGFLLPSIVLALAVVVLLSGCGGKHRRRPYPAAPAPRQAPSGVPPGEKGYAEVGIASWYGYPYHGRATANGEIYNMYDMTAAHRTLPFDTWVRVTNLENDRTTEVRINDRGPFVEGRIIDLSLAAAQAIGMYVNGTARVRVEVVRVPAGVSLTTGRFAVQVGAFLDRSNAERLQRQLEQRYESVVITQYDSPQGLFYRVRVGAAPTRDAADTLAQRLRGEGFMTFVVRVD